jgi:hypothetical protein
MSGDYGSMQTRIADELGRNDLAASLLNATVTPIQNAIQSAITQYEHERFWFNEARATTSTVAPVSGVGTSAYALPTDVVEIDTLSVTRNDTRTWLDEMPWTGIDALLGTTTSFGQPLYYAVYQQEFWLYPIPDAAYTLTLSYVKKLSTLSASTDTNAWMVEGEPLIRTRAKVLLLIETIKDPDGAGSLEALEQDILQRLRSRSGKLIATGHIRPFEF